MREGVKRVLAAIPAGAARGIGILIYHRVGGGTPDELDVSRSDFEHQVDVLAGARCVSLDAALDQVGTGSTAPGTVLTFDDGFRDVYDHAWPLLRERRLPFTVYLTSGCVGGGMRWAGSQARSQGAPALTWDQLAEMVGSGLCTVGNHTHTHARPEALTEAELDRCSDEVERHLGTRPEHFAYTWGVPVPTLEPALRARFRSSATGRLGRLLPGTDLALVPRIPVRRSDPPEFFRAKVTRGLLPERAYAAVVAGAKRAGLHA